jgi:hypothetical protein
MKAARPWKHIFWGEDFSIGDSASILPERIAGTKQVTDVYLAALALRSGGRLGNVRCPRCLASGKTRQQAFDRGSGVVRRIFRYRRWHSGIVSNTIGADHSPN